MRCMLVAWRAWRSWRLVSPTTGSQTSIKLAPMGPRPRAARCFAYKRGMPQRGHLQYPCSVTTLGSIFAEFARYVKGDLIMPYDETKSLTRRNFLARVGASAVMMTASSRVRASAATASADASPAGLPASEKSVNIGVVGGGFGSHFQWHLDPNCKVVAVCDLR